MKVLVTGGASGLGAAITRELAGDKDNFVYFTFCRAAENARRLEAEHPNVKGVHCDFSQEASIRSLMEEMGGWQLEALVNNALTGFLKKHFHKLDSEELLSSFRQNVLPVVLITQAALGTFRKQRFGKIVTILSSALANKPPVGWSEYVANKAYLLAMSKAWAAEYAKFNITANCISPTFMPTPLNADMDSRLVEEMKKNYPLQELLQPEEVAQTVHFLLKSTQQINGVNLLMNQGADIL